MKLRSGTLLPALIVSVGAVIMIAPYVVMISVSMKSQSAIYGDPLSLMPDFPAMIDNYYRAITLVPLWRFLWNGVVVCFVILSLQILTTVPCAYALAKIDFWGRDAALAIILVGLLVPYQIVAIPLYMALATAGVLNTYFALIAPFATSVFAIFLFRQFFRSFPDDLIHAARVDGLSEFAIVWRIVIPSAWPAITAFSIFSIIAHWNDLFWPLIVVSDPDMATPPLGALFFRDQESGSAAGPLMAGTLIITAPLIIAFLLAQTRFIEGITLSGLKG